MTHILKSRCSLTNEFAVKYLGRDPLQLVSSLPHPEAVLLVACAFILVQENCCEGSLCSLPLSCWHYECMMKVFLFVALSVAVVSSRVHAVLSGQSKRDDDSMRTRRQLQEDNNWLDQNSTSSTCPPCPLECPQAIEPEDGNQTEPLTLQILVVDSQGIVDMVAWNARDYEAFTNGKVKIEIKKAPTMPALFEEIENDARYGGGLFDAYYTNPVILGTAAILNGFLDLTSAVKSSPLAEWTDVLLALRTHVCSFEDKIYIILLDGDTHTLFYRKDVLEAFGLKPPRTWNEYIEVAATVHGKVFNGIELSGSCVSRIQGDHAMYWSHLILSTITQVDGTATGSLFDTKDMAPLTGEAFDEMLRIQEEQAKYGTPDEFDKVLNHVTNAHMNDGSCVLTFMWGDMFRRSKAEGSVLHDKLGIAPTPGSELVLNRDTGKLERCTRELCPYAKFYEDIGFVNSAPYAANGGWGAAISANTSPEKQAALTEFFLWASSKEQSMQYVIPNATLPWYEINGQDPWRKSHLDVDKWVARGFDRELSKQYVDSILENLVSKNVVVEARFPKAGEIMSVLDKAVNEHLVSVVGSSLSESAREEKRKRVSKWITEEWNHIVDSYNQRGDTIAPILEVYQRLRGVYVPNEQRNYLTKVRPAGLTVMCIIWAASLGSAFWVYLRRESAVVKASQPQFLGLISFGTFVMGASIFPMGFDESMASERACSRACTANVWLIAIGFSLCFAALFSKIWRLNMLFKSAVNCRRVTITVRDVLLPFAVLLILNVAFLLVWTIVDPLSWERVYEGRNGNGDLVSYGRCNSTGTESDIMLGLIAGTNSLALLLANIQAYQTRDIKVSFNESRYIALAMALILQAFLIGLPLLFLADTNPTARYFVRTFLVAVVCMSMLGFIFVPKLWLNERSNSERGNGQVDSDYAHRQSLSQFRGSEFAPRQSATQFMSSTIALPSASLGPQTENNE